MILANAGALHLDWERLSMSDYFEALEAYNDSQQTSGSKTSKADLDALREFEKAHGIG